MIFIHFVTIYMKNLYHILGPFPVCRCLKICQFTHLQE